MFGSGGLLKWIEGLGGIFLSISIGHTAWKRTGIMTNIRLLFGCLLISPASAVYWVLEKNKGYTNFWDWCDFWLPLAVIFGVSTSIVFVLRLISWLSDLPSPSNKQ